MSHSPNPYRPAHLAQTAGRTGAAFVRRAFAMMFVLCLGALLCAVPVQAADRAKLEAFLEVTGFGVALDSIALSASDAPAMLGLEKDAFGSSWTTTAQKVFDTELMRETAIEILAATLEDDLLAHAAGFYASPLGLRLVETENASHLDDSGKPYEEGQKIFADLVQGGSERITYFKRMNAAIDSSDTSVRAVQEIQVRFLMAAAAAGVIDMTMDEPDLRAALKADEGQMRRDMQMNSLINTAYVYRDFTDAEVLAYTEALEDERMKTVYDLMNAVQYEIMAQRFEVLAGEMAGLEAGQEL